MTAEELAVHGAAMGPISRAIRSGRLVEALERLVSLAGGDLRVALASLEGLSDAAHVDAAVEQLREDEAAALRIAGMAAT